MIKASQNFPSFNHSPSTKARSDHRFDWVPAVSSILGTRSSSQNFPSMVLISINPSMGMLQWRFISNPWKHRAKKLPGRSWKWISTPLQRCSVVLFQSSEVLPLLTLHTLNYTAGLWRLFLYCDFVFSKEGVVFKNVSRAAKASANTQKLLFLN